MLLWVRGMGKMPIPPTFYFFTFLLFYFFTFLLLILFLKLQFELSSTKQIVAHAVVWRGAVQAYALAVRLRGIALVLLPVVVGILLCKTVHVFVAKCLGEDARCGYRLILTVALHYRCVGQVAVVCEAVAVDDDRLGAHGELVERTVHGEEAGVEDVYAVDLLGRNHAHSPCHGVAHYLVAQRAACLLAKFLRVVEQSVVVVGRQNDGSSVHASSKTTATGFVAASLNEVGLVMGQQMGIAFLFFHLLFISMCIENKRNCRLLIFHMQS